MMYVRFCPAGMASVTACTILSACASSQELKPPASRQVPCLALVDQVHVQVLQIDEPHIRE